MKKVLPILKSLALFLLLQYSIPVFSQEPELQEFIEDMQSIITTVDADGRTYRQTIESPAPGKVEITVNETNAKGGESEIKYALALSDLNPRAIRSFTKGIIVLVEIVAKGSEKLIKKTWEGGDKMAYISDFILYGADVDNAGDLEQAFEDSVPFAIEVEQKGLALETYQDHLDWLTKNIRDVKLSDQKMEQRLSAGDGDEVTLRQVKDSRTTTSVFNLSQLNANSAEYHVSGDELFIEVRTKKDVKAVKYSVNGSLKEYRYLITLYANSPDALNKIRTVLKDIVPLAEKEFNDAKMDFTSESDVLSRVNDDLKQVVTVDGTIKQNIDLKNDTATVTVEEISDKRHLKHEYSFSLTDINALGIKNESTKSRVFLELPVKNGEPYIRHVENGEPQNYTHYVRLYFDSREEALRGEDALKTLIKDVQSQQEEADNSSRMTLKKAWPRLEEQVRDTENSGRSFEQKIEMLDIETSALRFVKVISDRKNTREFIYEFGAKEINPYTSEVHVSRSRVWVELIAKSKQKVIKVTEDGELRDYHYIVEIEAASIANAKNILQTFKRLSELYGERIGR